MPDTSVGTDVARLQPLEEAALALHAPDLDFNDVTALFERLVADLGFAKEPQFLGVPALRTMRRREEEAHLELVEVRQPDGLLIGALRFHPVSELGTHQTNVLAKHAGVALAAVKQLRTMERREAAVRRVAERLQDSLLPDVPSVYDTNVVVAYRAAAREAKVGGDFYDVFPLPDGRVLIVCGDVVGKGVEAAVRTSRITQTLRALALQNLDLDVLLERADEQVVYQDPDIMATLWCGLFDPRSGELAFASLGHPPALLLRSSGEPIRLELEGLPLGLRDLTPSPPEIRTRQLASRDLLVLYTDGVVEASRDFLAGQEALLRAVVQRRDEPLEEMLKGALDELLGKTNHSDDAVMMLLRRR